MRALKYRFLSFPFITERDTRQNSLTKNSSENVVATQIFIEFLENEHTKKNFTQIISQSRNLQKYLHC